MSYAQSGDTDNHNRSLVSSSFLANISTVTFNNIISGQSKTLIRQRALWRTGISAPSLAIYAINSDVAILL